MKGNMSNNNKKYGRELSFAEAAAAVTDQRIFNSKIWDNFELNQRWPPEPWGRVSVMSVGVCYT